VGQRDTQRWFDGTPEGHREGGDKQSPILKFSGSAFFTLSFAQFDGGHSAESSSY
jgi:hypothetical protein